MKRPLLLAALAVTAPAALCFGAKAQSILSPTGSADPNMTGATQRMFIINATTPGALTFSGAGTATFNNAVGTSNQFNVGSNTSIGVNASVSATPEFDGQSLGLMKLNDGSNLMQTNGTSSAAAATQAAAQAANTVATETARRESHAAGWEAAQTATNVSSTKSGNYGSYDSSGSWQWNDSYYKQNASDVSMTEAEWKAEQSAYSQFKNAYSNTYNATYNDNYTTAYSNVITNSSSTAEQSSASGIIKGNFKSQEDSISSVGQANALTAVSQAALASANQTGASPGQSAWNAAFQAAFNAGYQNSVGSVKSTSTSEVAIEGLGAIASVNADKTSTFTVDLKRLDAFKNPGDQENSTATANGSATSTLSTNSFATQNNQRTASAFMQAFAAAPQPTNVDLDTGVIYSSQTLGRVGGDGAVAPVGATPATPWVAPAN